MANRGRPPKYKTREELQRRIDEYFKECNQKQEPYTITGLCIALDICRDTLSEYLKNDDFSDTIKKAKIKVENYLEKRLINDSSTTGIIFNLKNNFNWSDKQQIEHSGSVNNPFEGLTTEELRKILNE